MTQEKEEILIEIVVTNEAAAKAIFENQQSIERLKQSQVELTKARKAGTITDEEYSKKSTAIKVAIDSQKESIRQNEKELKNNIKTQKDNTDSLAAMRAQLSNNIKAFDGLSKSERDSAKGQELQESINTLVEDLKEAEQATGRFQRQVGDYPGQTGKAAQGITHMTGFLGKMSAQVSMVSPQLGNMINQVGGFASKAASATVDVGHMNQSLNNTGAAANAVEGFAGKASGSLNNLGNTAKVAGSASTGAFSSIAQGAKALGTVFLTPPIIIIAAVVLAIVAAFKLLQTGFKLNDEASDKMAESMAVLQPILDYVGKLAGAFAGAIAELVGYLSEGIATMVDFTASLFGVQAGFTEAANEARNLVKAQDEIENSERDYTINSAKRASERARLLAEVADKEKNNATQRVAFLKDALVLDEKELAEKKRIAQLKFIVAVQEAKNINDTSIETQKKQAQLLADAVNADTAYFEGKKEINKKLSAAEKEIDAEQKELYDKWKVRNDDRIKKETQAVRQLEDLVIGQIKDEYQRQIEAETAKTERANEDLRKRLKTEENLTDVARKAINQTILLNEQNLIDKTTELIDKSYEASIKKDIEAKTKEIEARLQLSEKGSVDELNIKIAKLELQKTAELSNAELTNIERLAITDKYENQEVELKDKYLVEKQNRLKDSLNKEFEIISLDAKIKNENEIALAEIEVQRKQADYDRLIAMDQATKDALKLTQQDYEIAIKNSQLSLIESQKDLTKAQIDDAVAGAAAISSIANSLGDLATALSEDSEEAAEFARAMALVQIGIALATGIAGAVKQAAAATTWYEGVAALAVGIASVTSAIVSAKKALSSAGKTPKAPESNMKRLATGGLVSGPGSGTSDSINARLSNGESVINANSTSMFTPLLSALNQIGGGVEFGSQQVSNQLQGEDMLARAVARGVAMLPAPILDLREFHVADDRLTKIKEM